MAVVTSVGSGNYESGSTWDSGARAGNADDVVIASGHNVTLAQDEQANSLTIESGGTLTITGATRKIRIDSEADGTGVTTNGYAVKIDGAIVESGGGKLRLDIETADTTNLDIIPSSGNVHDLVINLGDAARVAKIQTGGPTLTGDLTITSGELRTENNALTVQGTTTIGPNSGAADQAKLTCGSGTISLGAAVTSGYALDVKRGGTFDGGSGTHTSGALKVTTDSNADAKLDLTSGNHTITAEYTSQNRFFELTTGTVTHSNGTIILDSAVTSEIQWSATTGDNGPYNLTLNDSGMTVSARTALTVLNNFTITAGTYTTLSAGGGADMDLTVTGHTAISSGGTLTLNASTCTFTGFLRNQGTFTGGSGTHTFGNGLRNDNNMTLTSGETRITGRGTGSLPDGNSTICFDDQGGTMNNGSGTINIGNGGDIGGTTNIRPSTSHDLNNVIINTTNSRTVKLESDCDIAGNLTITAGTFDTSTSNRALTVAGNTVVDGTLTGNNSTLTFGTDGVHGSTEGGCLLVNSSGTFTFGSGDVTIFSGFTAKGTEGSPNVTSTGGGDIIIKGRTNNGFMNSHSHQGTNITGDYIIDFDTTAIFDNRGGTTIACNTFIIKHDGRTYQPWSNSGQDLFKIIGNMSITQGTFDTKYSGQNSQHLTVTGNVTVGDGSGSANTAVITGNASTITLGSLTIDSDGKYDATSGTTTITTATGAGSSSNRAAFCHGSGTFTHNNGLFKTTAGNADVEFTSQSETNNPFYDFEATQYAIAATTPWVVLNNMTIANGFQFNGGTGYAKVLGIMKQTGGTYNAGDVSSSTNHFFNHYRLEGGTLDLSNIDITVGSIRNTGGTIS